MLCEKPMAKDYAQCLDMLEAEQNSPGRLMIGHCVRFYPQYEYLYEAVKENRYGSVIHASFSRVTPLPNWGNEKWRLEDSRAGSSMTELNIHDFDVVQHIFGCPKSLSCELESRITPYDYSLTHFNYDNFDVDIISAWLSEDGAFCMSYSVEFEKGILHFDGNDVFFAATDGTRTSPPLSSDDGIVREIGYFLRVLSENAENDLNPPQEFAHTDYLLEKCFESAENNSKTIEVSTI